MSNRTLPPEFANARKFVPPSESELRAARADQRRYQSCVGKQAFPDQQSAYVAGVILHKRSGVSTAPYECRYCGKWHMGTNGKGR